MEQRTNRSIKNINADMEVKCKLYKEAHPNMDEITKTEAKETQVDENKEQEQIQQIPIAELHPFEGHPFRVVDDEAMTQTVESVAQYGVLSPLIVRPDPDGGYEIISGHRRCHAAELARSVN